VKRGTDTKGREQKRRGRVKKRARVAAKPAQVVTYPTEGTPTKVNKGSQLGVRMGRRMKTKSVI